MTTSPPTFPPHSPAAGHTGLAIFQDQLVNFCKKSAVTVTGITLNPQSVWGVPPLQQCYLPVHEPGGCLSTYFRSLSFISIFVVIKAYVCTSFAKLIPKYFILGIVNTSYLQAFYLCLECFSPKFPHACSSYSAGPCSAPSSSERPSLSTLSPLPPRTLLDFLHTV